jgi:tetratricopeptide (TPR) repeat protein
MPTWLNLATRLNSELHDLPDAPEDMRAALASHIAQHAAAPDHGERMALAGQIGVYARILGDLETAERYLTEAVRLAQRANDRRALMINVIRLGHVWQWQRRFDLSNPLFSRLVKGIIEDPDLYDLRESAFQHAGMNYFDQGRFADALLCFAHAWELRLRTGNAELVGAAKLAMDITTVRLHGGAQGATKEMPKADV